jgi:hypothetical protein
MSIKLQYADTTYAAEDITALDAAITAALDRTEIMPTTDLATLKRLAKMGLKSESFSREALAEAKLHIDLMPRGLNVTRMETNIANRDLLRTRLAQIEELRARLRAAVILHGVDGYNDGLTVYRALQSNGDYRQAEAVGRLGRIFQKATEEEDDLPLEETPATAPSTESTQP